MRKAARHRLWIVVCAFVGWGGCTQANSAGGVDVTVSAPTLSAAQLTSLQYLLVAVSGVESNQYRMLADGLTPTHSQELAYMPSATSGALTIAVNAVDASGHVVATGSGTATLQSGRAKMTIVLAAPGTTSNVADMGVAGPMVTPAAATVGRNGSVSFSAGVAAAWSVAEPNGGTIDSSGTYQAPAIPGLYPVVASAGGGATTVTVTVAFNMLATLAGTPGGAGSVDGTGTAARFYFPGGDASLAANSAGTHLYVADRGNGTIRRIDVASAAVTTLAGVPGVDGANDSPSHPGDAPATFSQPWGIAVDAAEQHVYVADFGNATLRAIDLTMTPPRVSTIAGAPYQYGYADAPDGADARFNTLLGIALDEKHGLLYVAEYNNCRVRAVTIAGGATTTLTGNGNCGSVDSNPGPAQVSNPVGLALDDQNLYIAEVDGVVRKFTLSNDTLSTLAGTAGNNGNMDGTGSAALFNRPIGLASIGTASSGQLVVGDSGNDNVRLIVKSSGVVTTLAGPANGAGASGYVDATGTSARFNGVSGVTMLGGDALFVDANNSCLRRVASVTGSSHAVTTFAGQPGHAGSTNGAGAQAQFSMPYGLALSGTTAKGVAYVADTSNYRVRDLVITNAAGGGFAATVATLAGSGTEGTHDAVGTAATLGFVPGLVYDGANTVYIVDRDAGAIRSIDTTSGQVTTLAAKIDLPRGATLTDASTLYATTDTGAIVKVALPGGAATTMWGAAGNGIAVDGSAAEARFNYPTGIVYDGTGALYVADSSASSIRRVDLASGYVTTVVNIMGTVGTVDGPAAYAQLESPFGVAMLANGQLAITDNDVVRVYDPASQEVGTLLGVANVEGVLAGPAPGGLSFATGVAAFATGELLVESANESVIQIAN
ncbi:MAG TPA: hypothetical protein VIA18_22360 [Polyangia bacterium]|nr:hypothetical protein [Polyangia bacterium]